MVSEITDFRINQSVLPIIEGTEVFGMRGKVVELVDEDVDGNPAKSELYPKYVVHIHGRGRMVFFRWELQ